MWDDAHEADLRADVYGLGRVAAWARTNIWPKPNLELLPNDHWRPFVQRLTAHDRGERPRGMMRVVKLLQALLSDPPPKAVDTARSLVAELSEEDDESALFSLVRLAIDHSSEADVFLDCVVSMRDDQLLQIMKKDPKLAMSLISPMRKHLLRNFGRRDFDDSNQHLRWIFGLTKAAVKLEEYTVLHDASDTLFECEVEWRRFRQRHLTRAWLEQLRGEPARIVGEVLRMNHQARKWYLDEGWQPDAGSHNEIMAALKNG